jgi:Fe-S-cluster containining protein
VPELDKLPGEVCKHLDTKKNRCTIYATRPTTCMEYKCVYLQSAERGSKKMVGSMRPSRCHVVIEPTRGQTGGLVLKVDPKHPNAYLTGAVARFIVRNPDMPMVMRNKYLGPARAVNKAGVDLCRKYNADPNNIPEADADQVEQVRARRAAKDKVSG